ncbi:hypothetical protein AAMO2058_000534500 [Amorphochlora amoebiformis]
MGPSPLWLWVAVLVSTMTLLPIRNLPARRPSSTNIHRHISLPARIRPVSSELLRKCNVACSEQDDQEFFQAPSAMCAYLDQELSNGTRFPEMKAEAATFLSRLPSPQRENFVLDCVFCEAKEMGLKRSKTVAVAHLLLEALHDTTPPAGSSSKSPMAEIPKHIVEAWALACISERPRQKNTTNEPRRADFPLIPGRTVVKMLQVFDVRLENWATGGKEGRRKVAYAAEVYVKRMITVGERSIAVQMIIQLGLKSCVREALEMLAQQKATKEAASLAEWAGLHELLVDLLNKKAMSIFAWRYAVKKNLGHKFPKLKDGHDYAMMKRFCKMGSWDLAVAVAEYNGKQGIRNEVVKQAKNNIDALYEIKDAAMASGTTNQYPFPKNVARGGKERVWKPEDSYLKMPSNIPIHWIDTKKGLYKILNHILPNSKSTRHSSKNHHHSSRNIQESLTSLQDSLDDLSINTNPGDAIGNPRNSAVGLGGREEGPPIYVGIDAEWAPMIDGSSSVVNLLQMAAKDCVFLVDLQTLLKENNNGVFRVFNDTVGTIIRSKKIIKIGHGVRQDLKECSRSFPLQTCFREPQSVIELSSIWKQTFQKGNKRKVTAPASLSLMGQELLGKPLDKRKAMSDWARRPLAKAQKHYAALDAYVAIQIVNELEKQKDR